MERQVHTQLSRRNALPFLLALMFAIITLSLAACSRDESPVGLQTNVDRQNNDVTLKNNNTIDSWTDAGLVHTAVLRMADDSVAASNWPYRFTSVDGWSDWGTNLAADYLINFYEFDTSAVNPMRRRLLDQLPSCPNVSQFKLKIDSLATYQSISVREKSYLYRLADILYCPAILTKAQMTDSLDQFRDDVNSVTWTTTEVIIIPFMSCAWYSWDFWCNEGFDGCCSAFDPDNQSFDFVKEVLVADCVGGVIGGVFGGAGGAVAGFCEASEVEMVVEIVKIFL